MPDRATPLPRGSLAALVEEYAQALVSHHLVTAAPGATGMQRVAAAQRLDRAADDLRDALAALDAQDAP